MIWFDRIIYTLSVLIFKTDGLLGVTEGGDHVTGEHHAAGGW
jgi:hypothetical protein